jgi:hypothetical protein
VRYECSSFVLTQVPDNAAGVSHGESRRSSG